MNYMCNNRGKNKAQATVCMKVPTQQQSGRLKWILSLLLLRFFFSVVSVVCLVVPEYFGSVSQRLSLTRVKFYLFVCLFIICLIFGIYALFVVNTLLIYCSHYFLRSIRYVWQYGG